MGKQARTKVSEGVRRGMLNARNKAARARAGRTTGPLVWCYSLGTRAEHQQAKCERCGPRSRYSMRPFPPTAPKVRPEL